LKRKIKTALNVLSLVLTVCCWNLTAAAQCRVEETDYRGWDALKMSNELVQLFIVPEIGGRIIQFVFEGHAYLFVNESLAGRVLPYKEGEWNNYGGDKLWPAPQGWDGPHQWPGPGDPALDGGRFTYKILQARGNSASVRLISPPDREKTGLRFTRVISLKAGEPQVFFENTMTNVSDRNVSWSIWSVTQVDAADSGGEGYNDRLDFYCALNSHSIFPKKYAILYGLVNNFAWMPDYKNNVFRGSYNYIVGKAGIDSPRGWLASVDGKTGHVLVQRYDYCPGEKYPDDCSVEFWINGAGSYIAGKTLIQNPPDPQKTPYYFEMEIFSPFVTLRPGQSYTFRTEWKAMKGGLAELMAEVGLKARRP
jgi:1,2-phenylacetyl-CoA epoxidase PaaB subunit